MKKNVRPIRKVGVSDLIKLSRGNVNTIDIVEQFVSQKKLCSVCKENEWRYVYVYVGLKDMTWLDQIEFVCEECASAFKD